VSIEELVVTNPIAYGDRLYDNSDEQLFEFPQREDASMPFAPAGE
jgi:hypothetical protein